MNKLVLLKDVKKSSNINKYKNILKINNEHFNDFNEKFYKNINNANNNIEELCGLIEKIFLIDTKQPFLDFINFLYEDYIGINALVKVNSVDNNNQKHTIISAVDDYRKFEYKIEIKSYDENNIALYIKKKQIEMLDNVVSFQMKKNQYKKACDNDEKFSILKEKNEFKMIVIDSDIEIPDSFEACTNKENESEKYKLSILKSWKYDFKKLVEANMYILFPLKIFDLKKRLYALIKEGYSQEVLRKEITIFFNEMNSWLNKVRDNGRIDDRYIDEINFITKQIFKFFIQNKSLTISGVFGYI